MSARILTLAALGLAATAGVAPAQYFNRFASRTAGGYVGYSPYGGFYFNTFQSYQYSFQAMFNGRPVTYQYQFNYSGPPRPNFLFAPTYYGNPYASLSGGVGSSYGSDQYTPLANQQRAAIARAQRLMDAGNPVDGRKDEVENWVAAQQQDRGNDPAARPPIDPALLDPPDDAILTGKTLNELAALCRAREKAGRRADSGLCPPDLLEKVVFEGGATAAGVNLFRKTALPYPPVVLIPETEKLRAALDADFALIGQALRSGKRANSFAVDRMETNITAARAALNARTKDAPFAEAKEVNDFLNRLALAARFARGTTSPAALPASWNTSGATVAELIAFMDRFKLQFGPAADGGEPAYLALHRGLLEYYVRLSPVKKK